MLNDFDINNPPSNFCSVPWLQIHTEPGGEVQPCCYFSKWHELGNWKNNTIKEIYHGEKWNSLRKQFLNNEQPMGCSQCFKEEKFGIDSTRTRFNKMYQQTFDKHRRPHNKFIDIVAHTNSDGSVNDQLKLSTVDLIFNNLCNYKCRSCSPGYSTNWSQDAIKIAQLKGQHPPVFSVLLDNSKIDHLTEDLSDLVALIDDYSEVHFTGGEPMMQAEHYTFLSMLIAAGKTDVRIRYNTNLSVHELNGIDVFDLLKQFSDVFIIGSIDAIGAQGEYIRSGFVWETALNWLDKAMEKLPRANFGISLVYSMLNSFAAVDVHSFLLSQPKYSNFGFYLNILHGPSWLKPTLLPLDVKTEVVAKIKLHIDHIQTLIQSDTIKSSLGHWIDTLKYLESSDESGQLSTFFKETKLLDQIRNEDFKTTFPELYEKLKHYDI